MKSNAIIAGCIALLLVLAAALVAITLSAPGGAVHVSSVTADTAPHNWYYKPTKDHTQPVVADDAPFIGDYNALYLGSPDDKTIYITFDMGYDNGCTASILDALKEADAPAAFFVTGQFMKSSPALIRRMVEDGHLVCNHTLEHKDLCSPTDELFKSQVISLEDEYKTITGKEMPKYLRPPEGKYSEALLAYAKDKGYTPVFWSFAYKDWLNDAQPSKEDALKTIAERTHPGEVALLHGTSKTNAAIMGDILKQWKKDGYSFGSLDDLAKKQG